MKNQTVVVFKASGEAFAAEVPSEGQEGRLKALQGFVGGLIEQAYLLDYPKHTVYCNEEGLLLGLKRNHFFPQLVGDVVLLSNKQ